MNQVTGKLVFLIDSKSACKDGEICEKTLTAIRLAVLKTLTHLSSGYGNTVVREKLKWGFKIFDSAKECQMYRKRAGWLQHTHKNFVEFENHLRDEISCRCEKIRRKFPVARRSANQASGSSHIRRSSGYGQIGVSDKAINEDEADDSSSAYAVRYALQDVMNDFQWEEPDMCSPTKKSSSLKSTRPRKRTDSFRLTNSNKQSSHNSGAISKISVTDGRQKERRKERMIFLVMECPATISKMEDFVGDVTKLQSVQVLRDTLIARDFLMDFCARKSTSLFWLDSSLDFQGNANRELLDQVLSHVNGHLISVRGLLSSDDHVTSCLHSLEATHQVQEKERLKGDQIEKKCEEDENEEDCVPAEKIPVPRSFFPLSAIMQYHFDACQDDMNSSSSFPFASFQAGLCTRKGSVCTIHCVLKVMPMFSSEMDLALPRALSSGKSAVESDTPSDQSTKKSQTFTIHGIEEHWTGPRRRSQRSNPEVSTHQPPLFTLDMSIQSEPTPPSSTQSPDESTVTIRAKIGRDEVTLDCFESSRTFSCIGFECPAASGQCDSDARLSRWFMDAMVTLSKQKSALIVEVASPISGLVSMAVMEPLTPSLASIRLLHAKSVLSLVTVLAFQPLSSHGTQANEHIKQKKKSTDCMRHFVESSARKILKGRGTRHKEGCTTDTGESPVIPTSDPDTMEELAVVKAGPVNPFHPDWLEPWHISAPSRNSCDRVVEQLLSIPDDRPSPSLQASHHEELMERIKSVLAGKSGAEASRAPPLRSQPDGQGAETAVQEANSVRRSGRLKRIKSLPSFVGARTARILANSRTLQATKPKSPVKEQRGTGATKRKNDSIPADLPDFTVLEDLTTHLRQSYEDTLSKNSCSLAFTQSTVALVLHFFKTSKESCSHDDSMAKMKELISDNLLISNKQLRERYVQKGDDPEVRQVRVQEVEMQTLLRLEAESMAPVDVADARAESRRRREETGGGDDDEEEDSESDLPEPLKETVNEIVSMLSTVPILASGDKLSTFLRDVLLANYMETIPHVLRAIYEGLMKPIPALLMSPGSDTTNLQSVLQPLSYRSVSSGGSLNAVGSNSNRSRALVRHPSLADAGPKRIIGVPTRHLQNEKKKTGVVEKQKPKKEQDNEAKMVRRNLFTEESTENTKLGRRKSVTVMESQAVRRSPRKAMRSTKPVLKTRVVKETPGKKQVLKAMLNKLERARKHTNKDKVPPGGDLLVIEESPEKPVRALHPDPRRSPRIRTLQRRPSFYSKKQEIHHAKLLAARIAGTYSQVTQPKEQPQLPVGKDSESNKEISPASFLLSKITSPVVKEGSLLEDSPSRNTRSKVTGTPEGSKAESSVVPVRGSSKTTPRAKARRRLTDVLMEDATLKPPAVNSGMTTSQSPFKSPAKSPGMSKNVVCRHSPRLKKRSENSLQVTENLRIIGLSVSEHRDESDPDSQGVKTPQRQSPGKVCRRTSVVIVEQSRSCGKEEPSNLDVVKNEMDSEENAVNITSVSERFSEECSHNKLIAEERNGAYESNGKSGSQDTGTLCKVKEVAMSSPRTTIKQEDAPCDNSTGQQLQGQTTNASIPSGEPVHPEESLAWIDKIDMETPDDVQSDDKEDVSRRKRKRVTPEKVDVSTPRSKSSCFTKDASFPMSVPASKCTTPESINSWPRKKPRYNSPSPCTSKMQHPQNISPIEQIDQVMARWTSPRTKRQTPQSSTKKCPATGSGKKRKRQSPGVTSSEKKRRGGGTTPKRSPRARGSLLSMLTAKASLEERCISPIFGKPSSNISNATELLHPTESSKMELIHFMKKQLPTARGKSPQAKGNSSSMNSEGSLDELDRSFSPVFGKNGISYQGDSSQSSSSESSVAGELAGRVSMTITDQGLDCDTESDPEVDFPKLKSHSSTGSDGQLSDWDAVMLLSNDGQMVADMTKEEKKPSQRSRDMSKDAASGSRSLKRSDSAKASSIPPEDHDNQTMSRESIESKDVQRKQSQRDDKGDDNAVSPRRVLRKKKSSEKYLQEDMKGDGGEIVKENKKAAEAQSMYVMVQSSAKDAKADNIGDEENKRPKVISKQKKKKVTISSHLPQSLERKSTPSRLSMSLKRSSTGKDWTITDSPEPAALHGTVSRDISSLESSLSSADDDVFEAGSSSYTSPVGVASTPPTQSGKPNFVTTPLSASGLYSLMNSPMVDSARCKSASGSLKTSRSSRTSRRNLPLQ
ncbi:uncharacterized protein [Diadema setosum]|uniref:uncharacterized protein n=1 Tax=Diadema setosum TaxID=31175 RepID=UPI003B3BBF51